MIRITKVSVIEQVIKELQGLISSGDYEVGDKLPPELELCKDLGVSRSTVREAYRMLNAYGLVEIRPGRGAFVRRLHRDADHDSVRDWFIEKEAELLELMEVRMAVEPIAVRLAIKRATGKQVATITAIHERFAAAAARTDALELATLDEAFHTAIVEASSNRLLVKLNRLLVDEFREYRARAFSVEENIAHALAPHEAIVKAILEQDTAAAIEAMNGHLATSLEDIENVVKEN
jgi:GntR family transcriptional regulator, transcriptional repressor for pyruvate dehydrogenase complex